MTQRAAERLPRTTRRAEGGPPQPVSDSSQVDVPGAAAGPGGHKENSDGTAFVLSGGGSLGATQVGMLYALLEAGLRPDLLVGSSLGAINAAYLAGHPTLDGVDQLAAFWESVRRRDLFPLGLNRIVAGVVGRRDHLIDPLALRTLILRADLAFDRLEEAPVPFYPVATDLTTGEAVTLSHGDVVDALAASAAIPGVFPPVEIGDRVLIDGSITAGTPLSEAEALGATTIYVLPTASLSDAMSPRSAIDVAARAMFLSANRTTMVVTAEVASRLSVHVVPPPSVPSHASIDPRSTADLIDRGYCRAQAWLDDSPAALVA